MLKSFYLSTGTRKTTHLYGSKATSHFSMLLLFSQPFPLKLILNLNSSCTCMLSTRAHKLVHSHKFCHSPFILPSSYIDEHKFLSGFVTITSFSTHTHTYRSTLEKWVCVCCQVRSQRWLWPQTAECSVHAMGDTTKKMLQTFICSSILPAATVITFANFPAWEWRSVEEVTLTLQLLPINLQLKF